MKTTLGILLILAGIAAGLYCGLWWAFIGGICALIEAIKAPQLVALDVAISIVRILGAALIGWLSALVLIIPGVAFLKSE